MNKRKKRIIIGTIYIVTIVLICYFALLSINKSKQINNFNLELNGEQFIEIINRKKIEIKKKEIRKVHNEEKQKKLQEQQELQKQQEEQMIEEQQELEKQQNQENNNSNNSSSNSSSNSGGGSNTNNTTNSNNSNSKNSTSNSSSSSNSNTTNNQSQSTQSNVVQNYDQTSARQVLDLVNQTRIDNGLQPLTWNSSLEQSAMIRAKEIVSTFSHTRPDGSSCFTVLNIDYYSAGENIASGQSSAQSVFNAWMNSQHHRENILNPNYTQMAVSLYYDSSSNYKYNWVQLFIQN